MTDDFEKTKDRFSESLMTREQARAEIFGDFVPIEPSLKEWERVRKKYRRKNKHE